MTVLSPENRALLERVGTPNPYDWDPPEAVKYSAEALNRLIDAARAEGRKSGRWQGYEEGRDETEAALMPRRHK